MTEELPADEAAQSADAAPVEVERVRTGVQRVDEVIAAVEELEQRPIEEHVGVFETAHEQLRRALDSEAPAGQQPTT
jgi:hypothetical protein